MKITEILKIALFSILSPNIYFIGVFFGVVVSFGIMLALGFPQEPLYWVGLIICSIMVVPAVVMAVYNWIKQDILGKW